MYKFLIGLGISYAMLLDAAPYKLIFRDRDAGVERLELGEMELDDREAQVIQTASSDSISRWLKSKASHKHLPGTIPMELIQKFLKCIESYVAPLELEGLPIRLVYEDGNELILEVPQLIVRVVRGPYGSSRPSVPQGVWHCRFVDKEKVYRVTFQGHEGFKPGYDESYTLAELKDLGARNGNLYMLELHNYDFQDLQGLHRLIRHIRQAEAVAEDSQSDLKLSFPLARELIYTFFVNSETAYYGCSLYRGGKDWVLGFGFSTYLSLTANINVDGPGIDKGGDFSKIDECISYLQKGGRITIKKVKAGTKVFEINHVMEDPNGLKRLCLNSAETSQYIGTVREKYKRFIGELFAKIESLKVV